MIQRFEHSMSVLQDKDIHVSKVAVPSGGDIQSVFWTKYKEAATKHDNEVMKRHNRDMDVILIFVSPIVLVFYALMRRSSLVFSLLSILLSLSLVLEIPILGM